MTGSPRSQAHEGSWRPSGNPWLIAVVVTLAAFMELLDTTIVNVALPHIAGALSSSYDEATWTLTSYLVANSIVLPISAFFVRLLGRKRYFIICIVAFTACSFLCGISDNLGELVVFRLLQGFFGGGLQPNQQSIILDTFPPSQRGRAFSLTAIATVVAPVLGPTIGGWITDNYSWRWVFLINVPIGILTAFAVLSLVEDPPWAKRQAKVSIDYIGISLIALTFACLQIMLDRGEDADWFGSGFILIFATLAAIGGAAACAWLFYVHKPVVDLRVFKDRNFALGCSAIGCFAVILYGSAVLIPQLAQQHLGYTALLAGLVLSPGALCVILLIPILGAIMPRVQTRYIVAVGFLILGCSMLYSRMLAPGIDFRHLVMFRIAQSSGIGFLFVPLSVLTYQTIPRRLQGDATALFTMSRNVFGSVGVSLSTAAVATRTQVHMAYLSAHLSRANPNVQTTLSQIKTAIQTLSTVAGDATQAAMKQAYTTLVAQAGFLAYLDVFWYARCLRSRSFPSLSCSRREKSRRRPWSSLMYPARAAAPIVLCLTLAACKAGPNFVAPNEPVPDHYSGATPASAGATPASAGAAAPRPTGDSDPVAFWWQEFHDDELNRLEASAAAGNLDLKAAFIRIVEARIQVQAARAQGLPSLNGTASFTREQLGLAGILKSQGFPPPGTTTSATTQQLIASLERPVDIYQVGFDASWELDLFGKVRRAVEAANAQSAGAVEARNDLLVSLQAEVAQDYFQCGRGKC